MPNAARSQQLPEWATLSHINCLRQCDVGFQVSFLISLQPCDMRMSWRSCPTLQRMHKQNQNHEDRCQNLIYNLTCNLRYVEVKVQCDEVRRQNSGSKGTIIDMMKLCGNLAFSCYMAYWSRDDYHPSRTLRSTSALLLQQPSTVSFAARAFCAAAPTVWNSLGVHSKPVQLIHFWHLRTGLKLNCLNLATHNCFWRHRSSTQLNSTGDYGRRCLTPLCPHHN